MKFFIRLKDIYFYAFHGVLPHETSTGNNFIVNIKFEANLSNACHSDSVDDTINYASVYELIEKEMNVPSQLLEHAAYRVYKKIKDVFPQITALEVSVSKQNPPIKGNVKEAEITISDF